MKIVLLLIVMLVPVIMLVSTYNRISMSRHQVFMAVWRDKLTFQDAADILLWDIDTFMAEYKMWVEGDL